MFPYPDNVGIIIPANKDNLNVDLSSLELKNTIITIYGLPSTGKGTLSRIIAKKLGLPLFETGVMYRIATYFFISKNFEVSSENLILFKQSIDLDLLNGSVVVRLFGEIVVNENIRNPNIDSKLGDYAKIPQLRHEIDSLIADFVLKTSFVTDGRGAYDGYLMQAQNRGIKVIRVLLQAQQSERIRRRFIDYLALERGKDLTSTDVENLWKKCEEVVKYRDDEEVLKDKTLGLGMISEDSGILDTTDLSIDVATEAVLRWLANI